MADVTSVKFVYHAKQDMVRIFSLPVRSAEALREVKTKLARVLSSSYPPIDMTNHVIRISEEGKELSDESHLTLPAMRPLRRQRDEIVCTVHILPQTEKWLPVRVNFKRIRESESPELECALVFLPESGTIGDLREEIAKVASCSAGSLDISYPAEAGKSPDISQDEGYDASDDDSGVDSDDEDVQFRALQLPLTAKISDHPRIFYANCLLLAETDSQIHLKVEVTSDISSETAVLSLKAYLHDTMQHVLREVAAMMLTDSRFVKLYGGNAQVNSEKTLRDYKLDNGDKLRARVFKKGTLITVYHRKDIFRYSLCINDAARTTVGTLQAFVETKHKFVRDSVRLHFKSEELNPNCTLRDSGVAMDDILVVHTKVPGKAISGCRNQQHFSQDDITEIDEIPCGSLASTEAHSLSGQTSGGADQNSRCWKSRKKLHKTSTRRYQSNKPWSPVGKENENGENCTEPPVIGRSSELSMARWERAFHQIAESIHDQNIGEVDKTYEEADEDEEEGKSLAYVWSRSQPGGLPGRESRRRTFSVKTSGQEKNTSDTIQRFHEVHASVRRLRAQLIQITATVRSVRDGSAVGECPFERRQRLAEEATTAGFDSKPNVPICQKSAPDGCRLRECRHRSHLSSHRLPPTQTPPRVAEGCGSEREEPVKHQLPGPTSKVQTPQLNRGHNSNGKDDESSCEDTVGSICKRGPSRCRFKGATNDQRNTASGVVTSDDAMYGLSVTSVLQCESINENLSFCESQKTENISTWPILFHGDGNISDGHRLTSEGRSFGDRKRSEGNAHFEEHLEGSQTGRTETKYIAITRTPVFESTAQSAPETTVREDHEVIQKHVLQATEQRISVELDRFLDEAAASEDLLTVVDSKEFYRGKRTVARQTTLTQMDATAMTDPHMSQAISSLLSSPSKSAFPGVVSAHDPPGGIDDTLVRAVGEKLGLDWTSVCMHLGVTFKDVQRIKHNLPDLWDQATAGLQRWKELKGRDATPLALKKALLAKDLLTIADSILADEESDP